MKRARRSKTLVANSIIVLLASVKPVEQWISEHPSQTLQMLGILNIALRLLTDSGIRLELPVKKILTIIFAFGVATTASLPACAFSRAKHVVVDQVMDAITANDETGLVDCGHQVAPGFCYIRQVEGDAASSSLTFIGPPSKCDRDSCVSVKLYDNQGHVAWGDSFPKNAVRLTVPWSKVLGCVDGQPCNFEVSQRGTWTFNHEVYWKDAQGAERRSVSQGEIVLRVFRRGYLPLDTVRDDPNFAWTWTDGGLLYKVTTGLRAFVGKL